MTFFPKGAISTLSLEDKEIMLDVANNFKLPLNDSKLANEVHKLLEYRKGIFYVYKKVKEHERQYDKFYRKNYLKKE